MGGWGVLLIGQHGSPEVWSYLLANMGIQKWLFGTSENMHSCHKWLFDKRPFLKRPFEFQGYCHAKHKDSLRWYKSKLVWHDAGVQYAHTHTHQSCVQSIPDIPGTCRFNAAGSHDSSSLLAILQPFLPFVRLPPGLRFFLPYISLLAMFSYVLLCLSSRLSHA